jgi:hypothetical protein
MGVRGLFRSPSEEVVMRKNASIRRLAVLAALLLSFSAFAAAQAQAQAPTQGQAPAAKLKPEEVKKILLEIAGDYDFDMQGQPITITFFEKDGVLYGAPADQNPEVMTPAGDSPLKFTVTPAGGQFFEMEFFRNDKKVIDKCVVKAMGMELVGAKRIK